MAFTLSYSKILIALIVVILGIKYRETLQNYFYSNHSNSSTHANDVLENNVFTAEKLARFNGIQEKKLYLSVLGNVFDVTKGAKYYAKDSSYHYFVGKDGSRALITGNFQDESKEKDHVLDLSCSELFTILQWKNTFNDKYEMIGVLQGRYFDRNGKATEYSKELNNRLAQCVDEKESHRRHDLKYPPCNIAWSEDEGTKVWCSKTSGGISRDWVGVPRQLYNPGQDKPQCVCINLSQDYAEAQFKEYEKCPNTSTKCIVKSD